MRTDPNHPTVSCGCNRFQLRGVSCGDPDRATEALSALSSAGVQIADFALGQPSLDEVFLALTGHTAEEGPTDGAEDRAEGAA